MYALTGGIGGAVWTPEELRAKYTLKCGENNYQCSICYQTMQGNHAPEHVLSKHLAGPTKCPICDKKLVRARLRHHVSKVHNLSLDIYTMKLRHKEKWRNRQGTDKI